MKRVFGKIETIFDIFYLVTASIIGILLITSATTNSTRMLAGIMALVLAIGDTFHLLPRILVISTGKEEEYRNVLGRGKQITSITMTIFYLLLWHIGLIVFSPKGSFYWTLLVYIFALIRILLCLAPQNKWQDRFPPVSWGIYRNVPFFLQGMLVAGLFFLFRDASSGLAMVWLAILLSFLFYLPVVLWANKNPKIGMLMLPKTCAYLWLLFIFLSL